VVVKIRKEADWTPPPRITVTSLAPVRQTMRILMFCGPRPQNKTKLQLYSLDVSQIHIFGNTREERKTKALYCYSNPTNLANSTHLHLLPDFYPKHLKNLTSSPRRASFRKRKSKSLCSAPISSGLFWSELWDQTRVLGYRAQTSQQRRSYMRPIWQCLEKRILHIT